MLPDDLARCEAALLARGRSCRIVARTGSTNDDAKAWAAAGAPDGAVVIADAQDRGRGRHGRAWSSPSGESLALSVVLRPRVAATTLPQLALVAGLAAREAIARRVDGAMVKWPNDVTVGGRKLAGVLVEGAVNSRGVEHVVVGVGINVARRAFPEELASIATSLAALGATDLDRGALALDLLSALDREIAAWLLAPSSIGARLQPYDALRGRAVSLEDGTRGVCDGIEPDGRLRVLSGERVVLANAGEVRLQ